MRDVKSTFSAILLLKTYQNGFYVTIYYYSLKFFINVSAFLRYVEVNSKEIGLEISFPSSFRKELF